jgi:cell division protein FtsB
MSEPVPEVPNGGSAGSVEESKYARAARFKAARTGLVVLAVGVLLFGFGFGLYNSNQTLHAVRDQQKVTSPLVAQGADSNARIIALAEQIKSCTTPQGECAQRNAKSTGVALVVIVACAVRPDVRTLDDAKACVTDLLGRLSH